MKRKLHIFLREEVEEDVLGWFRVKVPKLFWKKVNNTKYNKPPPKTLGLDPENRITTQLLNLSFFLKYNSFRLE